jgi:DUF971 family protein
MNWRCWSCRRTPSRFSRRMNSRLYVQSPSARTNGQALRPPVTQSAKADFVGIAANSFDGKHNDANSFDGKKTHNTANSFDGKNVLVHEGAIP